MKKYTRVLALGALAMLSLPSFSSEPDLPRVEILGKEYYYHEIKKGESIYGIARKYDWNLEELVRLNPNSASEMKKGSRLYYPTGRVTVVNEVHVEPVSLDTVYEPIRHVVKKGETVYSIARQYNMPLDAIYAAYPEAKRGIKAGETLILPQTADRVTGKYLYYVVKSGDTLYSLAQKYHTSVEDILKSNPGVSENSFRIGDTVRIPVDSNSTRLHTELVEEERLASIDTYKVKKNDTWKSISQKTGVNEETLREANEDVKIPEKNEIINVPVTETVTVEREMPGSRDPRELSADGIKELYDSIHGLDSEMEQLREVKVALLLDDPTSKKDIDFSRGFLLALNGMKNAPFKINFKIIDGRHSSASVTEELDDFEPNLLVATADKGFPAFLADYGETNKVEIINAFDVRNELYEDNPSVIQILPPSSLFNEQIADKIGEEYGSSELLLTGIADENDAIAELIVTKFPEKNVKKISVNSLENYNVTDEGSYLIYGYPQKREEVSELLATVKNLKEQHPLAEITVMGRPSWVTIADTFKEKFNGSDILVPARCWLDTDSDEGKAFEESFNEMFEQTPVKSFPNFAASGYDIANYFINSAARNGGDFNKKVKVDSKGVQTDFQLKRVSNWGGFLNPVVYMLRFRPSGVVDTEILNN